MKHSYCSSLYAVGGYWILTYVKKIWQYKCVHNKAFNILFGSEYIVDEYHI